MNTQRDFNNDFPKDCCNFLLCDVTILYTLKNYGVILFGMLIHSFVRFSTLIWFARYFRSHAIYKRVLRVASKERHAEGI